MQKLFERASNNFLELSSLQRLQILFKLMEKKSKPAELVKEFNSTKQEVYRNFSRLEDGFFIIKDVDGNYDLTEFGRTICLQIPSIVFLSEYMDYFKHHNFGNMPKKFYMRVGQLGDSQYIKGLGKVLETWKDLYRNAEQYIYLATSEIILDLDKILVDQIKKGVRLNYVLSENCSVPKGRKETMKKLGFDKFIDNGTVERKMRKTIHSAVVLNEKEGFISFPDTAGEPDLAEVFYSKSPDFHEWCFDFFNYYWNDAHSFQENKLKEH